MRELILETRQGTDKGKMNFIKLETFDLPKAEADKRHRRRFFLVLLFVVCIAFVSLLAFLLR